MAPGTEDEQLPAGCELAIAAQAFYITNMLLAPGLGAALLVFLYLHCARRKAPAIALNHLRQAIFATAWAGVVLAVFLGLIVVTGGYPSAWFWPLMGIYFVVFHLPMSWFGVQGLGRALAGEDYRYPLVGARLLQDTSAAPA
ncbi:MAG: hypothetical protein QNK18_18515 [Gammaproteobacteria bacterium]|nr:hypothetical protein [Gammaproteobacteria bacterium]